MNVMTVQTWAYIHNQLDFPKYKRTKVHILKNSSRSYCGIRNIGETGELSWQDFLNLGDNACTKCRHLAPIPEEEL